MVTQSVTRIRYFELIRNGEAAVFGKHFEEAVEPGRYVERIKSAAADGGIPGDIRGEAFNNPHAADASLDIFAASNEVCAYAFRINPENDRDPRLRFARPNPFIKIPLNSSSGEDFLTDLYTYEEEPGLWASFVCDLRAVRTSALAQRIRALPGSDEPPGRARLLTIPFCFNFVDLALEASPWVVPDRNPVTAPLLTHGGVHPQSMVDLIVEL